MASYDSSSVRESEEQSLESTVPTDLTLSPESDESRRRHTLLPVTKQLIERKQLIHDVQLLKIELSQKTLLIDNLKAEYMSKTEELQDKLADALNQKQLLQMRLETQINIQAAESKTNIDQLTQEMGNILQKQRQLEQMNEKLREKAGEIKDCLDGIELTENEYLGLKRQPSDNISLREHVAIKIYEASWPFKLDAKMMRQKIKNLQDDSHKRREQLEILNEELLSGKSQTRVLTTRLEKALLDLKQSESKIQEDIQKVQNFNKVKSEKDTLERHLIELKKTWSSSQTENIALRKEIEDLRPEQMSMRQKILLLQHDKEYLTKRNEELQTQIANLEDRVSHVTLQMEKEKESREEIYERYITSRDSYKSDYDRRLKQELEETQMKAASDMDKLRSSMKNMYEQEIKNVRESRDVSLVQREKVEAMHKEISLKYERLLQDFHQFQNTETGKMAGLESHLKVKSFELDQLKLLHADTNELLKGTRRANDNFQQKIQVLTEEIYNVKYTTKSNVADIQTQLAEKNARLAEYEKIENDIDEMVMQSAKAPNNNEGNFLYNVGSKIPTNVNRRLQQCVHLAKQVLQMEQQNMTLKVELNQKSDHIKDISEELETAKSILNQVDQPYSTVASLMQSKEKLIKQQNKCIQQLSEEIRKVQAVKEEMDTKSQQQAEDIQKLLAHKEEITAMKLTLQRIRGSVPKQFAHF